MIFLLLSSFPILPAALQAEFNCAADVSFRWRSVPVTEKDVKTEDNQAAPDKPKETFFEMVTAKGEKEEAAREELEKKLAPVKERALRQCREQYENQSACIATKYSKMESVLNTLDFKARDELQKAIHQDCLRQTGSCIEAAAGEVKCREIVTASVEAQQTPEAGKTAEAGKESGKGKKETGKKK